MSDLVLETVEESCAFGEDIVLVGLREKRGLGETRAGTEFLITEQRRIFLYRQHLYYRFMVHLRRFR